MRYAQDERGGGEDRGVYRSLGLKELARVRYDIPDYKWDFDTFNRTPNHMKPWDKFYRYQAQDCYLTLLVHRDIKEELNDESPRLMPMVKEILVPLTQALVDVELHGFMMDVEYLEAQKELFTFDVGILSEELQGVAFHLGWKGTKTWQKEEEIRRKRFEKAGQPWTEHLPEFKSSSSMQVKMMLFEKLRMTTKGGTTERDDLQALLNTIDRDNDTAHWDFVHLLMEVRLRSRMLSTYIQGMLNRVDLDNRVRTTFNVTRTDTGRLASSDPNLQNIPSEDVNVEMGKRIKRAFIVPEGYTLINADQSQIELRVAAWLSQDQIMIQAFQEKKDIHTTVAMMIFHLPVEKITKALRYCAKFVDFPIIYGRTPQSLVDGWENEVYEQLSGKRWTVKEVQGFFESFLNEFKGLASWIRKEQTQTLKCGFVEMPTERRRRFPLRIPRTYGEISRKAVNTPIQGFAGELTEMAIARMRYSLPSHAHVISTVHDSVMVEVRNDQLAETIKIMRYEMEENLHVKMNVPLVAEFETGTNWAELTKWEG
jgi:DNA polymerase-1